MLFSHRKSLAFCPLYSYFIPGFRNFADPLGFLTSQLEVSVLPLRNLHWNKHPMWGSEIGLDLQLEKFNNWLQSGTNVGLIQMEGCTDTGTGLNDEMHKCILGLMRKVNSCHKYLQQVKSRICHSTWRLKLFRQHSLWQPKLIFLFKYIKSKRPHNLEVSSIRLFQVLMSPVFFFLTLSLQGPRYYLLLNLSSMSSHLLGTPSWKIMDPLIKITNTISGQSWGFCS